MTREEATALLRRPPKSYKAPSKGRRKAVVAALIEQATESTACIRHSLQGLYAILALPAMESNVALRQMEEWQAALCCVMVEPSPPNLQQQCLKAPPAPALPDDEEVSAWSTAKQEYSQFDTWLASGEAQATPRAILDVLCANRAVFPDKLPTGLPPKRPHDHRIVLVPWKLPTKSATYRMTPEQLQFHKQEIAKLSANGWPIPPPYPPIQTILEMLGGTQYFSTLDLDAEGIKPAADKIQAIKAWPEVLENETQIRQLLGTVNYCRAVLEQAGQPIGFLSQTMTPAQQRYSIYNQELLALVAALDKWAHLLRATKVTAHTDHQALTHLQQLKASKPLRGRTARWLDFLAEFPDLTITYLPALGLATDPPDPPHKTRGTHTDYRKLACLRRRPSRKRSPSSPVTAPPPAPSSAPKSPTPADPPQTPTPSVLDWPAAYSKCPVFSEPYHTASSKPGEVVRLEF
ncbi:hypothetical protein EBH_0022110 [Eimeria brunetti]|uniref:Reverse transcriptase RNase H-like domain-containing protein n=1 Tax=Eimeria brunetti TaxID=51314 RepID=U6LEE3_9EIME|nr:hypothetical protein EBH_0022110 [Eimeria brunetti]